MRIVFCVVLVIALLGCAFKVFAHAQKPGPTKQSAASQNASTDPGERAFRQNCGRCHNPPDSLSPREAKAVLQQMRVRAMLTEKDEKLILKYLAP
jgi:cytochrome c5